MKNDTKTPTTNFAHANISGNGLHAQRLAMRAALHQKRHLRNARWQGN
jgi:hypothetical protein